MQKLDRITQGITLVVTCLCAGVLAFFLLQDVAPSMGLAGVSKLYFAYNAQCGYTEQVASTVNDVAGEVKVEASPYSDRLTEMIQAGRLVEATVTQVRDLQEEEIVTDQQVEQRLQAAAAVICEALTQNQVALSRAIAN